MDRRSVTLVVMRTGLLVVSLAFCVVLAEVVLRTILNPVNFLRPELENDAVLGHRVKSRSAGHDEWGFRNEEVPSSVDIVTIGDSQTYGVSAMAFNSWPSWLGRISEASVYNLSLGGYGPLQYERLLESKALELDPETIVLGIYLGNDIFDAYRVAYGLDAWAERREPELPHLVSPYKGVEGKSRSSLPVRVRAWIGRHSVLYRLAVSSLGQALGQLEMQFRDLPAGITLLEDEGLRTAFTPRSRLKGVDRTRPEVREGLRLSFEAFENIIAMCRTKETRLVVVVIPTKEAVFANRLRGRSELANSDAIEKLLLAEEQLTKEILDFFRERDIATVDPRASMRAAAEEGPIYPSNEGGHPVSAGYRAIADAIAVELR